MEWTVDVDEQEFLKSMDNSDIADMVGIELVDEFATDDIVSQVGYGDLLDEIGVDEVISHFEIKVAEE